MKDNRNEIEQAFNTYKEEAANFWDKGNASAGARARAALMDLKNLVSAERNAIQETKNSRKAAK